MSDEIEIPKPQLWRRPYGHPRKYENPVDLWNAALDYFEFCTNNPIDTPKGDKPRAMSKEGLCRFLGMAKQSYYKQSERGEDWEYVLEMIHDVIYDQKFTHGMVEVFNPMLVARDLNLAENSRLSMPDGALINNTQNMGVTFEGVGIGDFDDEE